MLFYRPIRGGIIHKLVLDKCKHISATTINHPHKSIIPVFDSTSKVYDTLVLHGFTIKYEGNLFTDPTMKTFQDVINNDLEQVIILICTVLYCTGTVCCCKVKLSYNNLLHIIYYILHITYCILRMIGL